MGGACKPPTTVVRKILPRNIFMVIDVLVLSAGRRAFTLNATVLFIFCVCSGGCGIANHPMQI